MGQADRPHQPDPGAGRPDRAEPVRPEDPRLTSLFSFVQVEVPWPLGPPDGRYLVRPPGSPDAAATHVIVLAALDAAERRPRRLAARRRPRDVDPRPEPAPVPTGRATIVDVAAPLDGEGAARAWLDRAGEGELAAGLQVLDRALHAFRVAAADPGARPVARAHLLVARVGFGAGEEVADGVWSSARELPAPAPGRRVGRRTAAIAPQARFASILGAREAALACEELALRARSDLDRGRPREAALQLIAALDAALVELAADPAGPALAGRLSELRALRDPAGAAAGAILGGPPGAPGLDGAHAPVQLDAVSTALSRLEAALRARAAIAIGPRRQ